MKKWLNDIAYSFPLQLLFLHLRSYPLLIICWIVIGLLMSGNLGNIFGIKYLFLTPEYFGEVNSLSYYFLGLGFGAFLMTWNLATYLLTAHHFPFLATLQKPFTKFSINNSLVPLFFLVYYLIHTIYFKLYFEFDDAGTIALHCFSFLGGALSFILLAAIYFFYTNKDILSFLKIPKEEAEKLLAPLTSGRKAKQMESLKKGKNRWRVDTYLNESLSPRLVRPVGHYDPKLLLKVFKQNHVNALIVQILGLLVLVCLGFMIDNPYFRIPAGTSIFILGTIIVAVTGATIYWFEQWTLTFMVALLMLINYISSFSMFGHHNKAYGLEYTKERPTYDYESLVKQIQPAQIAADKITTIERLNNWRARFPADKPPKMVVYCVSGGGTKAMVWVMKVMQECDDLLEEPITPRATLITGASGGMIGASYMRELYLQKENGRSIQPMDEKYIDQLSQDLLNSMAFTIISNDLFLPWLKFDYEGKTYQKDRGYIFEKQLNENTLGILDKPLSAYLEPEQAGITPAIILTPYIVNDGRQLMISPTGVSYMCTAPIAQTLPGAVEMDAIDFGKFFEKQGSDRLRFTSALRMSATYPYILPNVHMPSTPSIEIMDAGLRDNYGIGSATRFIQVFQDWIKENTSGVVMIQITALNKLEEIDQNDDKSLFSSLVNPLGVAGQILSLQDYELDKSIGFVYDILGPEYFDVVRFVYKPSKKNPRASVTFHLTKREKKDILEAINNDQNQAAMVRLKTVLSE